MRTVWIWFWMSCKRYMCRVSFVVILLVLPAAAWCIRGLEKRDESVIRIAVCVQDAGKEDACAEDTERTESIEGTESTEGTEGTESARPPLETELMECLISSDDGSDPGMFRFYACEDERQLREDVEARRAECGYVFAGDLRRRMDERNYRRCIEVYTAPSTVTAKLASEVVFAAMISLYDRELFQRYVAESPVFDEVIKDGGYDRRVLAEEGDRLYEKWMNNGDTFRFVYRQSDASGRNTDVDADEDVGVDTDVESAPAVFPVRGIVAVYVLIVGLYGAAVNVEDEKKGLFLPLFYGLRTSCRVAALAGPVVLAAMSGLVSIYSGQCGRELWREAAAMSVYVLAVVAFSWILRLFCRRAEIICCLIPFFLVGSLVFCPVFVDIGRYLPEFSAAGKLFLPTYYLKIF